MFMWIGIPVAIFMVIIMIDLFYELFKIDKKPSIPKGTKFYDKSWTLE
jgi:TM2 domain-containing membrane protein YozV